MKKQMIHFTLLLLVSFVVQASNGDATLRQGIAIDVQPVPPVIANILNTDIKRARSYPMQPPIIPHKIRNYQIDLKTNKCLSCHHRTRVEDSQAPMVSVTHYMDREGNFLATVSPRRYFCLQCHVIQTNAKVLVGSDFVDMDKLLKNSGSGQ